MDAPTNRLRRSSRSGPVTGLIGLAAAVALAATGCAGSGGSGGSEGPPVLAIGTSTAGRGADTAAAPSVAGGDGLYHPLAGYRLTTTLPSGPGSAPAYRLPAAAAPPETVTRLAAALGLTTAPVRTGNDWAVRSKGSVLRVYGAAGTPWVYARADRVDCPPLPLDGYPGPNAGVSCSAPAATAVPAPAPSGGAPRAAAPTPTPSPTPDADASLAAAAPVLGAVGLAGVPLQTAPGSVTAEQSVPGVRTVGWTTTLTVDSAGVATGTGWLGNAVAADTYPLIGAGSAFDQLKNAPQPMMPLLCRQDLPHCGIGEPREVTVTAVTLGLVLRTDATGPVLVPAWLFTLDGGGDPTAIVAVAPQFLADPAAPSASTSGQAVPPAPAQTGAPEAVPGSPGSG